MLGFAVVDHRAGSGVVAVWLTGRLTASRADHHNAVKIDLDADVNALKKVHALTWERLVVLTDGSTAEELPISPSTLTIENLDTLVSKTADLQAQIVEAIDAYGKKTKNKNLVRPTFDRPVSLDSFVPSEDTATQRAFQTANFIAAVWTQWLATDDERRKRSENPRGKKSPWIMPEHMSSTVIEEFPATFVDGFTVQPTEAFNA